MSTSGKGNDTTVNEWVDRMLNLLRSKMQEVGMSQLDVQVALSWGRTYISQLFRKQKALRVDQVLKILETLGVEPKDFFAELFGLSEPTSTVPTRSQREHLDRVLSEPSQARQRTGQREDPSVSHKEFSATVRSLVCYFATLGGAPIEHFIEIYRHEMGRDGLLPEGEGAHDRHQEHNDEDGDEEDGKN